MPAKGAPVRVLSRLGVSRQVLSRPVLGVLALVVVLVPSSGSGGANAVAAVPPYAGPTPGVACDHGSIPETTQGRVPLADITSGRAALGYTCNTRQVSHFGSTGGFRVERYVDKAGHACAYYDSTLLFPKDVATQGTETSGTYVLDLTDPAHPVHTDTLRTPAFQSPHESVRLNQKRGLLVADMGYPTTNPGFVDVFDVTADCRHPVLRSSSPLGVLGHESGFSPDGNTFWVASLFARTLAAVDLTDPTLPSIAFFTYAYEPHGVSISNDGNRLYMADNGNKGLTILDISQVQRRVLNPTVPVVSHHTWPGISTPQNATPFTVKGHRYLEENDEFGAPNGPVGGARIIDIQDERHPFVVSNLRLAVNQAAALAGDEKNDPGMSGPLANLQGYAAHYCSLPSRVDPTIIACSFIMSGLRIFDIRDVRHPKEIGYFNGPVKPSSNPAQGGAYAMAAPAYDPVRRDVWYSDGNSGFYVVHLDAASGITSFAKTNVLPGN